MILRYSFFVGGGCAARRHLCASELEGVTREERTCRRRRVQRKVGSGMLAWEDFWIFLLSFLSLCVLDSEKSQLVQIFTFTRARCFCRSAAPELDRRFLPPRGNSQTTSALLLLFLLQWQKSERDRTKTFYSSTVYLATESGILFYVIFSYYSFC